MSDWQPAYVGVGSNLDGPEARVANAIAALAGLPQSRLVAASPRYLTDPIGRTDQPPFVNAVAGLLTRLAAPDLHAELQALQRRLGRTVDVVRWGPRHIDLDLLVYADERLTEPSLVLPHPRMVERGFVLYPLADIAEFLEVPGHGQVRRLLRQLPEQGVRRLD